MFGDFAKNFGLQFPFQGADSQGGLFQPNTGPALDASTGVSPQATAPNSPNPPAAQGVATPTGQPQGQSPLASPLGPDQSIAPAAGVGGQFGKAAL